MAGIYLHIPFCKTRCVYCDFYSGTQHGLKERFTEALCKELVYRSSYTGKHPIETIYFGGGTPSQLQQEDFSKIFGTLFSTYHLEQCREITLEANPDDLTPDYLASLAGFPFNRISMGVQSFDAANLKLLNRRHTGEQAIKAVRGCREAGITNISIDLMYGLPGQTVEKWKADIHKAIELEPEHISAYHLIYEEGTPLMRMLKQDTVTEADEELSLELFDLLISSLKKAGYLHYEVSNFAKPGKFSVHNTNYWLGESYLGCGPSAHSFNGDTRQWNVSSLESYIRNVDTLEKISEVEVLDLYTRYNEFVITSLRTMWGLDLEKGESSFGKELMAHCLLNATPYINSGKLKLESNKLVVTTEGTFVSDRIMSDLLWVE